LINTLIERRVTEYFLVLVLLLMTLMMGSLGFVFFEKPHDGLDDLESSFWMTLFSLISTQYSTDYPATLGGKLVVLFTIFSGLTFFAVLTGTVSAFMIEKLKEGGILNMTELEDLEGHVIICGWNTGAEIVLAQLQQDAQFRERDYVVIAERDELPVITGVNRARVRLLKEDFTRVEVLRKANVMTAAVAVIVSDVAHGRSRQDADARTVLASLTIEKLNPSVHTCAELSNSMNEHHLRLGNINEVVITQDLAGRLLAQAALDSTRSRVLQQMLRESSLAPHKVAGALVGQKFAAVLSSLC
jgi:voltage-gated potassium channel